jgi:hypothetical protein
MDELLALCSDSLIQRLAGTNDPTLLRSLAGQRIIECVGTLKPRHARALAWRFGLEGEIVDATTIAERLLVPVARVDALLDEALEELGWTLACGAAPAWLSKVAA